MRTCLIALAALSLTLGAAACGDDGGTIIELTILETIPVDFDDMAPNTDERAIVSLADLRDEAEYADVQAQLACGALDVADSYIEVEALTVTAGATALTYSVDVSPQGADQWSPLFTFSGSVEDGERIELTDTKVQIEAAGLQTIADVILGSPPALDVRITASVPGSLDNLQVAVSLALDFSTERNGCPSLSTGL